MIIALSLPVLLGFTGFAVDAGYWYANNEDLQTAADAGALAAARANNPDPTAAQATAVAAANMATNNKYNFVAPGKVPANSSILTATLVPAPGNTGYTVNTVASTPGDKFFSGILYKATPTLAQPATAKIVSTSIPPVTAQCGDLGGTTTATSHVAGIDLGACGNTSLTQPATSLQQGPGEGQVNGTANYYGNNGGKLISPTANVNAPSSVPNCQSAYNPQSPTQGSYVNGVPVYFGPATVSNNYYGPSYNFGPVVVSAGDTLFCNGTDVCSIPAGAYCGGLQINPGVTYNFVANNSAGIQFYILDGNMLLASNDAAGTTNVPSAPFFFGGASVGQLVSDTSTQVYVGGITDGTVVYTSTAVSQSVANGGSINLGDQICNQGSLPQGLNGYNPYCAQESNVTNNGQTIVSLDPNSTGQGQTSAIASYQNGTPNKILQSTDTYTTAITYKNGVPVYWSAVEQTSTGYLIESHGKFTYSSAKNGSLGVSGSGDLIAGTTGAPDPLSSNCTASSSNNLYSSTSPSGLGQSYTDGNGNAGTTTITESVNVCGSGAKLAVSTSGNNIVASAGSTTQTAFLSK
ncbi:MAG TPA: pilus assembly protein TadG-related protein [Acetobacteraceae bacterium]|nr:pilus assembly protein TadG-related protein [Acetobacteraceae bacterium]